MEKTKSVRDGTEAYGSKKPPVKRLTENLVDRLDDQTLSQANDPIAMAHFWAEYDYYPWQTNVLMDLAKPGAHVHLVGPNEMGKTSLIADVGLYFMSRYPGCQVVSTAGVFRQIEEQLWPVVRAKVARFEGWRITEDKLYAPSVDGLPASTWTIFATSDPKKAEGYHPRRYNDENGTSRYCPLIYIIDEAKAVDTGIFEAMYRCDPDHVLVASSPGEEDGEFYNIFHEWELTRTRGSRMKDGKPVQSIWTVHKVRWEDCPHLNVGRKKAMREYLIRQYGLNSPFIQSMIFGNFYRVGGHYIFNMSKVEEAMSGLIMEMGRDRKCGVDLAGGGDEIVISVFIGNTQKLLEPTHEKDAHKVARWLDMTFRKWVLKANEITIDEGGLGQPIIDELEALGWRGINRYSFDGDPSQPNLYNTIAMEDHHKLAMMISRGEIKLLPDEGLKDQMRSRRYLLPNANGGIMELESKKKLRKKNIPSPDRLDATLMSSRNMPDYMGQSKKNVVKFMGTHMTMEDVEDYVGGSSGSPYGNMRMNE